MKEFPLFFVRDNLFLRFSPLGGEDYDNPTYLEVSVWELVKADDTKYVTKSFINYKWYGRLGSETLDMFSEKSYPDPKQIIKEIFPKAKEYLPKPTVNFLIIPVQDLELKNQPKDENEL